MASRHTVGLKLDLRLIMFSGKEKVHVVENLVLVATLLASCPEKWGEPGYKASYHCAA